MAKATTAASSKPTVKFVKLRGSENVSAHISEDTILIKISRKVKGRPSKSGKTIVLASTRGNSEIDGTGGMKLGLNAYLPADPPEEEEDDE